MTQPTLNSDLVAVEFIPESGNQPITHWVHRIDATQLIPAGLRAGMRTGTTLRLITTNPSTQATKQGVVSYHGSTFTTYRPPQTE